MNKLTRILLRIGISVTLVAAVAFVVFVFALGNAVRNSDQAVICGDLLLGGHRILSEVPYMKYYLTSDTLNPGPKAVWSFRKELLQDKTALAEMKAQAQRCNFEFAILPGPPASTPYPASNASPRVTTPP